MAAIFLLSLQLNFWSLKVPQIMGNKNSEPISGSLLVDDLSVLENPIFLVNLKLGVRMESGFLSEFSKKIQTTHTFNIITLIFYINLHQDSID
jgi:hypothetical protein